MTELAEQPAEPEREPTLRTLMAADYLVRTVESQCWRVRDDGTIEVLNYRGPSTVDVGISVGTPEGANGFKGFTVTDRKVTIAGPLEDIDLALF